MSSGNTARPRQTADNAQNAPGSSTTAVSTTHSAACENRSSLDKQAAEIQRLRTALADARKSEASLKAALSRKEMVAARGKAEVDRMRNEIAELKADCANQSALALKEAKKAEEFQKFFLAARTSGFTFESLYKAEKLRADQEFSRAQGLKAKLAAVTEELENCKKQEAEEIEAFDTPEQPAINSTITRQPGASRSTSLCLTTPGNEVAPQLSRGYHAIRSTQNDQPNLLVNPNNQVGPQLDIGFSIGGTAHDSEMVPKSVWEREKRRADNEMARADIEQVSINQMRLRIRKEKDRINQDGAKVLRMKAIFKSSLIKTQRRADHEATRVRKLEALLKSSSNSEASSQHGADNHNDNPAKKKRRTA